MTGVFTVIHGSRARLPGSERLRTYAIAVWLCGCALAGVAPGCGQTSPNVTYSDSKLDAEESGYDTRYRGIHTSVSNLAHALVDSMSDEVKYRKLGDNDKRVAATATRKDKREELIAEGRRSLKDLKSTIPPESMARRHQRLIELLAELDTSDGIEQYAIDYLEAGKAFNDAVEKRSARELRSGELNVSYQPPRSPISVGVGLESGEFTVSVGVNTPIGNFSVSASGSSTVKLLVIRSFGKQRFFSLDRSFKVLTPPGFGVQISVPDSGDTLVVDIQAGEASDARIAADSRRAPSEAAIPPPTVAEAPSIPDPAPGDEDDADAVGEDEDEDEDEDEFDRNEAKTRLLIEYEEENLPWRIQLASYPSLAAAQADFDVFGRAGLADFHVASQGDLFILLAGKYASFEAAKSDAVTATAVRRQGVVVVDYRRWCPEKESHEDYDACSVWGVKVEFEADNLAAAARKQEELAGQNQPCEIVKTGSLYRLRRGPFARKKDAREAALGSGMGDAQHLDNICPAAQDSYDGYLTCSEWSPRTFQVPYGASSGASPSEVMDPFG